ncbi:MAG: TIGR03067 domain-containing protein, partial [Gemmataceae bacterium]|nr:TIGR03067 domain-containing protein [Gemmataceae bacterium]
MKRLTMTALFATAWLAITVGAVGGSPKKTPIDGGWIAVEMEQDGKKLPADVVDKLAIRLTIKGDVYTVSMSGQIVDRGTAKIDAKSKPTTVDITSEDGVNKGKTILAIIEVDGDTLRACYDMEGKGRPTEF